MEYKFILSSILKPLRLFFLILILWASLSFGASVEPSVELVLNPPHPKAGEKFELVARVKWRGPADAYYVKPPDFEPPRRLHSGSYRIEVSRSDRMTIRNYTYNLTCDEPGAYSIEPLEFTLVDKSTDEAFTLASGSLDVEVSEKVFNPRTALQKARALPYSRYLGFGLIALGVLAGVAAALLYLRRSKRGEEIEETNSGPEASKSSKSREGR